jgi:hypothetical protein
MMYSKLAAQDDTLPVHVFAGEAWLAAEVAALRGHVESNGMSKWRLCAERVSAVFGSPGRSAVACCNYYRDNNIVAGADGEVVQVKKTTAMRKARRPRRHRIARPASLFRRRPSANKIKC